MPISASDECPLSSSSLRYTLRPPAVAGGPGPRGTRPFGLWFTRTVPTPTRPAVRFCHLLRVGVDEHGRPLIDRRAGDEDDPPPKEWESKTYSDGDEGQEEDTWGWEEQQ